MTKAELMTRNAELKLENAALKLKIEKLNDVLMRIAEGESTIVQNICDYLLGEEDETRG